MSRNLLVIYKYLVLISSLVCTSVSNEIVVKIQSDVKIYGSQMTTITGRLVLAFRGIPFAEPPLDELRFQPPIPKKWTTKEFNATQEGPECAQTTLFTLNPRGQEDCLILNVFTHSTSKPLRKVMVFIHGGAFVRGSSNQYGPRRLLERDVVLVTVNYRLGAVGFLSTMDDASPGNQALFDQTEALKWVQTNIASFGGDPNKVTIFGESAGSICVLNHLLSPVSKVMAIAQSGNLLNSFSEQENPAKWTNHLAKEVGCLSPNTTEMIKCLREISVFQLIAVDDKLNEQGPIAEFGPVVDGHFHSQLPSKLFRSGQISNRVPLMFGVTKDEGLLFYPFIYYKSRELSNEMLRNLLSTALNRNSKSIPNDAVELIRKQYFSDADDLSKNATKLQITMAAVITDGGFFVSHIQGAKVFLSSGLKPFLYSFDYVTDHSVLKLIGITEKMGASHADDLNFLFDSSEIFPQQYNIPNDETENKFLDIWTSFAENGYPIEETANGKVNWKPAEHPDQILVYHLDNEITMENYQPKDDWRLDFWGKQIPTLLTNYKRDKNEL